MRRVITESVKSTTGGTFSPLYQPYYLYDSSSSYTYTPPSPPTSGDSTGFNLNSKVSPSILLIIIILAIIFFVSGLLHLLVRILTRPMARDTEDSDNGTAFQGQLQQLFHLHDAGVDQSFIDTLPVFSYKAIIGLKNPFDCAVCLCEFESEDQLRLLPQCSHAFHMECIDTWLLSHSTCPLCRAGLVPEHAPNNCSPIVLVLESGSESSRELCTDRDQASMSTPCSIGRTNSQLGFCSNHEHGSTRVEAVGGEKVVAVKLGKFRNVDHDQGSTSGASHGNVDARRCFSMGSFAYVMDDGTSLQVPIRMTPTRKPSGKNHILPLVPGYRAAMSESGCDSRREFTAFDLSKISEIGNINGNALGKSKRESFSVSKIWMRGKKDKQNPSEGSSRRAFSFRFPTRRGSNVDEDPKEIKYSGGRTISEMGISRLEGSSTLGSEFGHCDEEHQSFGILEAEAKTPSFARRTLNWIVGRQKKVVHSSSTTPSNLDSF